MLSKLFGKWAGVASAGAILVVAVVKAVKPELIDTEVAVAIMSALGIHASAADSAVK